MTVNLTKLERDWFQTRVTGATPQMPMNQLKRTYYIEELGGSIPARVSTGELEDRWLRKVINDNGGTANADESNLWVQALATLGETPTSFINQNKIKFYLTYSP